MGFLIFHGGPTGARDSPPSPGSLIFQDAIRSILNSPFGRTDSILAPIKTKNCFLKTPLFEKRGFANQMVDRPGLEPGT